MIRLASLILASALLAPAAHAQPACNRRRPAPSGDPTAGVATAGAAIYHFGHHPRSPMIEAIWQDRVRGQNDTPVFKLINPDNTGGSNEVILGNDGFDANGWGQGWKK